MGALENTLGPIADAIVKRQEGLALVGRPFKDLLRPQGVKIVRILRNRVEKNTKGLTLRAPALTLFHGYVSVPHLPLVLCAVGVSEPVRRRDEVIMGWFLTDGGLLPAAFESEPISAHAYMRAMEA